jgi:hypothetical protein
MKKYESIPNMPGKELKIEVFYDKGGMNYFNSSVNKRGYYVSARVVERDSSRGYTIESFMMFGGKKKFLFEVKKQSKKAYEQAVAMYENDLDGLKQAVLNDPASLK